MRITARATRNSEWHTAISLDDLSREVEIPLPADVSADDVDVFVHYLNGAGEVDPTRKAVVLKTSKRPKLASRSIKRGSNQGNVAGE
jgi:hypothetical protein